MLVVQCIISDTAAMLRTSHTIDGGGTTENAGFVHISRCRTVYNDWTKCLPYYSSNPLNKQAVICLGQSHIEVQTFN